MDALSKPKPQLKGVLDEIRVLENRSKRNLNLRHDTPLSKPSQPQTHVGVQHFGGFGEPADHMNVDYTEAQEIMDELALLYNHKLKAAAHLSPDRRDRENISDMLIDDRTIPRVTDQTSGYHSFGTPLKASKHKSFLETSGKHLPDGRDHMTFRPVYPPQREDPHPDLFEYTEEGVSIIAGPAAAGGVGIQSISLMDNSRGGLDASGLEAFLQQHEASKFQQDHDDKLELSVLSNKNLSRPHPNQEVLGKLYPPGYELHYDAFKALESDLHMDTDPETRRLADFLYERRKEDIRNLENTRASDHFNFREGEDQFRDSARALVEREARTLRMLKERRKNRFLDEFQSMFNVATSRITEIIDENKILEEEIRLGELVNNQLSEMVGQTDQDQHLEGQERADISIGGDSFYTKLLGHPKTPSRNFGRSKSPVSRVDMKQVRDTSPGHFRKKPRHLETGLMPLESIAPSTPPLLSESYFIVLESLLDLLTILKTRNAAVRISNEVLFGSPGSDQGIIRRELPRLLNELEDKRLEFDHRYAFLFYSRLRGELRIRDSELLESKHHLQRITQRTLQIKKSLDLATSIVGVDEEHTLNKSAVDLFLTMKSGWGSHPRTDHTHLGQKGFSQTIGSPGLVREERVRKTPNSSQLHHKVKHLEGSPGLNLSELYVRGRSPDRQPTTTVQETYREIKDLLRVWLDTKQ